LFPSQVAGYGSNGADLHISRVPSPFRNKFDELSGIRNGARISHRVNRGETARRRGSGTRQNCLSTFASGLPKMGMKVDESWESDESVRVDYSIGRSRD
jgi:hypothetical protein